MKVLITGANGQLGNALCASKPKNVEIFAFNKNEFDITDQKKCHLLINEIQPDLLINCAAYTNVDKAESDIHKAYLINSSGPLFLAEEMRKINGRIIQISTDFVFDGLNRNKPYRPYSKRNPIGIYGKSKVIGEEAIEKVFRNSQKGLIIRTSWLMGSIGKNFALTMLKLHSRNEAISVVSDQIGSPTCTHTLAKACWCISNLMMNNFSFIEGKTPILHFCDKGITTWFDIAVAIGEIGEKIGLLTKRADIKSITSSEYPTEAKRPLYSVLETTSSKNLIGINEIKWYDSLREMLEFNKNSIKNNL